MIHIGVARHIQPETSPAFAVVRRCEQTIDDLGKSVGRRIVDESVHLFGVGGRPIKSKVARRISVRLPAGATGFSPRDSRPARMKRSMAVLGQLSSLTTGIGAFRTG